MTDPVAKQFSIPIERFDDAVESTELLVFLVDHEEYRRLEPHHVAEMTRARMVVDTRNFLDHQRWREAGFEVYRLGVGGEGNNS